MNIVVQKPVPVEKAGAKERINPMSGRQILAPDLQSFLGKVSKEHARDTFCVLGITVVDLYPREGLFPYFQQDLFVSSLRYY